MYSKPLTYDSLKTVLYHLDPNIRFLISIRIPSLRVTERSVPLKIEYFQFRSHEFEVNKFEINKTSYSLDVCSEKRDDLFTSSFNRDVDEYGEMDEKSGRTVMPGDVVFKPLDFHPIRPDMTEEKMNEEIDYYEKYLRKERARLALLESVVPENFVEGTTNNNDFVETPGNFNWGYFWTFRNEDETQMRALENNLEVETARRVAVSSTESSIKLNEYCLQTLLNRRHNVRPNFEIKLEITSPSGVRTERVKYTAKLYSAEKSLLKMMFGNRKHVMQVKKLVISHCMAIRLPLGMKMKIRELVSYGNIGRFYSALSSIIVNSSYPLEKLGIGYDPEVGQDTDHKAVQSAESLTLFSGFFSTRLLTILSNLQNKKVHARDYYTMTTEKHVQLIKRWLEVGKPIGTCYTFAMLDEEKGQAILEMVEQQCDGAVVGDKCVVIPMNVSSELKVSNACLPVETYERLTFRMEVLPRGSHLI